MNGLLLVGGTLLLMGIVTALMVLFSPAEEPQLQKLRAFAVLPVPDSKPATRAFLEYYAGQFSWMDSSILCTVLLTCHETDTQTCELCRELCRQYDFMQFLTLPELHSMIESAFPQEKTEKN